MAGRLAWCCGCSVRGACLVPLVTETSQHGLEIAQLVTNVCGCNTIRSATCFMSCISKASTNLTPGSCRLQFRQLLCRVQVTHVRKSLQRLRQKARAVFWFLCLGRRQFEHEPLQHAVDVVVALRQLRWQAFAFFHPRQHGH